MALEHLIGKGLQRESSSTEEIRRFLSKIATKVNDAREQRISLDSRFDIAYEALLQIGLVALRAHDLRPDSRGGHHVLALQTLGTTIGAPREQVRLLDEFRRQRAVGLYDGSFVPTEKELGELISNVEEIQGRLERWLIANRPDL